MVHHLKDVRIQIKIYDFGIFFFWKNFGNVVIDDSINFGKYFQCAPSGHEQIIGFGFVKWLKFGVDEAYYFFYLLV